MNLSEIDLSNVNILLVVAGMVLVFNVAEGYKKGMVKELISFVSLIVISVVAVLIGGGIKSYYDGRIFNVVVVVLLLCVVGIVRHLLDVVFFSAKVISKLPIVSWVNKVLGIVFGALETVMLLWILYTFVMMLDLGTIGQLVVDYTKESRILSWLYQHNYLAYLIEQIGLQIGK